MAVLLHPKYSILVYIPEFERTNKKIGSAGGGNGKIKWYGVPHTERRSSKRYKGCYG